MAQSGYTPISLYYSATGAAVPTAGNLVAGELALNTNDGNLYFKNSSGVVTLLAGSTSGPAGGSTTQVQYNNAGVLAGITGATSNGTALTLVAPNLGSPASVGTMPAFTLGGTVSGGGNQINNVIIGTTTPLAGAFTTVSATGLTSIVNATSTSDGLVINSGNAGAKYNIYRNSTGYLRLQGAQVGFSGLEVADGSTTIFSVGSTGAATISNGLAVTGTLSATGTLSGGTSGTAYSFSGSAPATSLTLTSGGDVGIGTSSPVGRLEAVGGTGAGFNGWFRTGDATAANNAGGGFYNTSSATATSRRAVMALDADGANLGGGDYFVIEKYGNSGTADLLQYSNAAMRFGTNYTSRATYDMTLDANGDLVVGSSTSSAIANKNIDVNGTGDAAFVVRVGGTTTSYLYSTAGTTILGTATSIPLVFQTAGTERARFNSTGALVFAGGTTTADGIGITFPATQSASSNANTLDDYEEGTWTAGFATWTTAPTSLLTSYTKIGRQVTLNMVGFGGVCAAASTITGIPFQNHSLEEHLFFALRVQTWLGSPH